MNHYDSILIQFQMDERHLTVNGLSSFLLAAYKGTSNKSLDTLHIEF